jgi:hypothetical protein
MSDLASAGRVGAHSVLITGVATVAGLLTRPCCLLPALLAFGGTGSAAFTEAAVTYRPVFLVASGVMLAASLWLNVRWRAHPVNKVAFALAALAAFAFAARPLSHWTLW